LAAVFHVEPLIHGTEAMAPPPGPPPGSVGRVQASTEPRAGCVPTCPSPSGRTAAALEAAQARAIAATRRIRMRSSIGSGGGAL
jgi:hypothetical protein